MLPDTLIEKVQKEKLKPVTRAKVLRRLINEFGLTTGEIAKRIGRSPSYVSNTLRLLALPEALKDGLASGQISSGHARALAAIDDKRKMIAAYKQILRGEGSVRKAEALARKMKEEMAKKPQKKVNDVLERMKREISQALGGAKVNLSRSRVQTRITILLKGGHGEAERWLQKIHQRLTKPNLLKGQ